MAGSKQHPEPDLQQELSSPNTYTQSKELVHPRRSCYACNRKKVRCDKREPCSSCKRSGKPCSYPASAPRVRRSKKTIAAEMTSRISALEIALAKATNEQECCNDQARSPISKRRTYTISTTPTTRKAGPREKSRKLQEDVLVQKGSSSQYFNEALLSRVIGEEYDIKSALTASSQKASRFQSISPFDALGILSSPNHLQTPQIFHPPRPVAVRLWNTYVNNVESCAGLKLLHLPTHEIQVYATIDNPSKADHESLALCFTIYFAATVSVEDKETNTLFEADKNAYLLSFKLGLEQALAQGDLLDCPTLTGLHALAIYLSALRVKNHGKGTWILNGLAIRIAESLGLHRDGKQLGLSPFQSEIRRRLWWHLISRDGRAGEDYGLENTKGMCLTSDVRLPLNVDDVDLDPEMEELPTARTGWTYMTFSLINIELVKAMQKAAADARSCLPSSLLNDRIRMQTISETRARIGEHLKHCNPVIPQHRMTLYCSHFLLRKLNFTTRQQWLLLQHPHSHQDFTTEDSLIEALELLEYRLAGEDDLLRQFSWARKAYPQYHVTMYILWHLCVKPEGPNTSRAWKAIDTLSKDEQGEELFSGFGPKSAVLAALRTKAILVRGKSGNSNSEMISEFDDNGMGLEREENQPGTAIVPPDPLGDGFDVGNEDWSQWANLFQSL